jgi:hypothetical protein
MLGIDLFFDLDWVEVVGHPQMQFPNGLCLARRVLRECPDDKESALLLTNRGPDRGPWQKWFENNDWVLGTEFVGVLGERPIDVENIADFLMQAYDGFLDVVEIKRPEGKLRFWADALDHGNYVPTPTRSRPLLRPPPTSWRSSARLTA